MVLQGLSDLDEHTASKYPGIGNYATCQSRAFVQGLLGMIVGGGVGAVATFAFQRYIPHFPARYNVFYVTGAAVLSGYIVTAQASRKCQRKLVQSQHEKIAADRQNLANLETNGSDSLNKRNAIPLDSQRNASSADKMLAETDLPNWKPTKYGDVLG